MPSISPQPLKAEVESDARSCSADTTSGICGNLTGFFDAMKGLHSFVGAYCNDEYLVLWSHGSAVTRRADLFAVVCAPRHAGDASSAAEELNCAVGRRVVFTVGSL